MAEDFGKKVGKSVVVKGWVDAIRDQGGIKFVVLRIENEKIQLVVSKNHHDAYNSIKDLTCESVIEASGKVKAENQAPGGFEIEAEEIKTL